MARVSPSVLSMAGRVGGYRRAALYNGQAVTAAARAKFDASFEQGHGCKVCVRVDLPPDLSDGERRRRAKALRSAHFAAVALRSARARAGRKAS